MSLLKIQRLEKSLLKFSNIDPQIKDSDEHRSSIGKMTTENQKLHTTIRNLEKDIGDLKSEIKSRCRS
jgi:cell division protein FtsB